MIRNMVGSFYKEWEALLLALVLIVVIAILASA